MAIRSRKNQYIGVNAHLMSYLQTPGRENQPSSWPGFHAQYITYLAEFLNRELPSGYLAVPEQSLQILGEYDEGFSPHEKSIPDLTLFRQRAPSAPASGVVLAPTWEILDDLAQPEERFTAAIVIYEQSGVEPWGTPITRIELLSRSNKPGGANYRDYLKKRSAALRALMPLVEIDLLHESRSPVPRSPVYPFAERSYPYSVTVSDPRYGGNVLVQAYGFSVDAPFRDFPLPLAGKDTLAFNAGAAYQRAFEAVPWYLVVDYAELPVRFETYSADDQARIRDRMMAVQQAHARGASLEDGPFII